MTHTIRLHRNLANMPSCRHESQFADSKFNSTTMAVKLAAWIIQTSAVKNSVNLLPCRQVDFTVSDLTTELTGRPTDFVSANRPVGALACRRLGLLPWLASVIYFVSAEASEATATWSFTNFVLYCIEFGVDSSHMTASSSASRSRFGPPSNFVNGHVSTMWFVVCRWPQSQEGDWARPHLCQLAQRGTWPVLKWFIS